MRALSYIGAEKFTFPPKSDGRTDRHTDRWTDISIYRVASLLKRKLHSRHFYVYILEESEKVFLKKHKFHAILTSRRNLEKKLA